MLIKMLPIYVYDSGSDYEKIQIGKLFYLPSNLFRL